MVDSNHGLDVVIEGKVGRLTLNRPDRRNALSLDLIQKLDETLVSLGKEPGLRILVLGSVGPVFSSGHDLKELADAEPGSAETIFHACEQMMLRLRSLPFPVVARVQGYAVAAGCQLVAACDLAVAVHGANFSTPGVKIGLFCSTPMVPLVRTIAPRAAAEMLFTGLPISATRACELGLINRVVDESELDVAIDSIVQPILAASPESIRLGKRLFYQTLSMSEPQAYSKATGAMVDGAGTDDAREGISAFLQKRPPKWKTSDQTQGED